MTSKLLLLLSPCHTYVEAFGGGASLLFAKPPSPVEVYNDIDEGLVNFFRVLRNPEQFEEFHRLVSLTPYSRTEYNNCRAHWRDYDDPVQRTWAWFVVARMSFSGHFGSGISTVITESSHGMVQTAATWLSAIENLPQVAARLLQVQIENEDWRVILERYDTPHTTFYLDPPYIHETRKAKRYNYEMDDNDHAELVQTLLHIQGNAMLSGYPHDLYTPLEDAGWVRHEFQTACHAAGRTRATGIKGEGAALAMQPRTEVVWVKGR